ncbi:MAG: L,D-transpeptidase family protein [Zavarzinia sp.]|nr:L,D-transpeptidase family protein [Zavarzinia sp.]
MDIHVFPDGRVRFAGHTYPASLGRAGIVTDKREGDGGTPAGSWPLRRVLYRPDRMLAPACALPVSAIGPNDGWCDDPGDPAYNRPVTLPFPASHERMWRDDHLYDVVVVVGHNDAPPVPGAGSAIFMHLRPEDGGPTAGCVALALPDLLTVLAGLSPDGRLVVHPAE